MFPSAKNIVNVYFCLCCTVLYLGERRNLYDNEDDDDSFSVTNNETKNRRAAKKKSCQMPFHRIGYYT